MSPEQWGAIPRDGGTEIDGRADVYSLGLILYEMVAGHRAFEGETTAALRKAHLSAAAPPLHDAAEGIAPAASAVIERAMAKDRGDRQATPGQVVAELRAAMRGADLAVPTQVATARLTSDSAPRDRRLAGLAVGLLVLLAGGMLAAVMATRTARTPSAETVPGSVEPRRARFAYSFLLGECRRDGTETGALDQIAGDEAAIFRTGEGLRLRMVPNSPGYLYIFNEAPPTSDGRDPKLTVLYPESDPNSGRALSTGTVFEYPEPGSRALLCFDEGSGTERLYLVFADEPLPELEAARAAFNTTDMGAVSDPAQAKAIRELLARYPGGSYDAERDLATKQTTVRSAGPVTVVQLSLEHRKGR
jgi:hypothetical protein